MKYLILSLFLLPISLFGQKTQLFKNNIVKIERLSKLSDNVIFDFKNKEFNFKKVSVSSGNFDVVDNKNTTVNIEQGKFYHDYKNNASLSVFGNQFVLIYDTLEVFNNGRKTYQIRPQSKVPFNCYTDDGSIGENRLETISQASMVGCRSIKIYLEADYKLYTDNGSSIQATVNYITALFNQVKLLYLNEQINVEISQIKVWNVQDPYVQYSSIATVLNSFRTNLGTNFNGNLAHFLSSRNLGGGIAYVDVLCFKQYAFGVSAIKTTFLNVPTYSWSVEVFTHELGHNIGSWHTHSCNWPNGPIDNCYSPEGSCSSGPAPINGGTIMSYCHLTNYGINFNNGFGPVPGNYIRSKYNNATCLTSFIVLPTNLTSDSITVNSAKISWNSIPNTTFIIQYKKASDLDWITTVTSSNKVTLTNLSAATNYQWKIKTNCSDFSNIQNFTTLNNTTCNVITNVTFSNITKTSFNVSWLSVPLAQNYIIQYRKFGNTNWIEYSNIPSTTLSVSNLLANTKYEFRIRPNCNNQFSIIFYVTTLADTNPCVAPTNLKVIELTGNSAILSWDKNPTAINYEMALKFPNSSNFFTIGYKFINPTVHFYGFTPNSTYQWKVRTNCSDWSVVNTFTTLSNITSPIEGSIQITNKIVVYPNPTTSEINIVGNNNQEYQLFDNIGKLVLYGNIIENKIDISSFVNGLYFLKVDGKFIKVIIQK